MARIAMLFGGGVLTLLGGALGGYVGARWVEPRAEVESEEVESSSSIDSTELDELDQRIAALERLQLKSRTEERVGAFAARMAAKRGDRAGAAGSGSQGPERPKTSVDDPVFEAAVRDVVDRVRDERDAERDERRRRHMEERTKAWSEQLGEALALSAGQREKMREIASSFHEQARALWRQGADGGAPLSWRERREQVRELRASYEAKLGEFLDGRQLQAYEELDPEERLGMIGGRRGRSPR